ncbi:glycosyltransferase family 2 protein [Colwellia sp. BRX10-4]|jgi:glycosyltransferase involved in cell wall biosynthesis|uniref:glycosyltransferase family 2 protein n=1 Tax=Colwellia sp. BRX10-4 TaxID=2759843 RepID=UPI0015F3FA4F|nr:glycosyltransferase family 2 protein [Colwellia sp. BRX10-4]MBA6396523.1 glycosyltransferase family 2 protein [Colwellia sp. BRX10-4]
MFSIVTASYNRVNLLPRLYYSLYNQKMKIDWIIVDDGSTDNTKEYLDSIKNNEFVNIIYIYQDNQGKHRALNNGMKYVKLPWVAVIDSDDMIEESCLENVSNHISRLNLDEEASVGAIIFNSKDMNGDLIGTNFPFGEMKAKTFEYYDKYNITGDKFDFYKSIVLKKFPFPEFTNERFISESTVWSRINEEYDSYFINEAYQIVEYQEGGLSDMSFLNRVKSPNGACLCYYEASKRSLSTKKNIRNKSNYYRFRLHGGHEVNLGLKINFNLECITPLLIGLSLFLKDQYKIVFHRRIKKAND